MPCTGSIIIGQAKDVACQCPSMMASRMTSEHLSLLGANGVVAPDNEGVGCGGADERESSSKSVIFKFSNFSSSSWKNSSSEGRFLQAAAVPLIGKASQVDLLLPGSRTDAGRTALSRFSGAGGGEGCPNPHQHSAVIVP